MCVLGKKMLLLNCSEYVCLISELKIVISKNLGLCPAVSLLSNRLKKKLKAHCNWQLLAPFLLVSLGILIYYS